MASKSGLSVNDVTEDHFECLGLPDGSTLENVAIQYFQGTLFIRQADGKVRYLTAHRQHQSVQVNFLNTRYDLRKAKKFAKFVGLPVTSVRVLRNKHRAKAEANARASAIRGLELDAANLGFKVVPK